jgi:alpha-L-fucosidase 2
MRAIVSPRVAPITMVACVLLTVVPASAQPAPDPWALRLAAPIATWDEAVPLGNGLTGGLLWGEGRVIRLSLDRGDLWDNRTPETYREPGWTYANMRALVKAKNQAELVRLFDDPFEHVTYPTKLPGARLELTLDEGRTLGEFRLDLRRAVGRAAFDGGHLDVVFSANEPVTVMRLRGSHAVPKLVAPAALAELGYEAAQRGEGPGEAWLTQDAALGFRYAVAVVWRARETDTEFAVAIEAGRTNADVRGAAMTRARAALARGYDAIETPHTEWWRQFWATSTVTVPDAAIQQHYNLVRYFYGAASRRDAPPMPLQGVWTADAGKLPPWKGDFHFDLNVQLTYWPYLTAGHFDEGASLLDFLWNLVSRHRTFAQTFYGTGGIVLPGVMGLDGQPLAGWGQYSLSPVQGAWMAQTFEQHWRYTGDRTFLAERAYPYASMVGEGILGLMKPDAAGHLALPLSSSPEIHDNSLQAWLTPMSNYDLALIRWLFGALGTMARELGKEDEAARWDAKLAQMAPLVVDDMTKVLRVSPDESLMASHRHFSHLMSIHPLGTLTVEGNARDRDVVLASLDNLASLGTTQWVGYSFSWAACLEARAARAERALSYLSTFVRAFVLRNGFHVNGDQTKSGLSNFTYRPFTLEGNFAAMQAVHEMLLQSWGGTVRVFPAMPAAWKDATIERLRAEGGYEVSATRKDGGTARVSVTATRSGTLRLRDPFNGGGAWTVTAEAPGSKPRTVVPKRDSQDLLIPLEKGDRLRGHR